MHIFLLKSNKLFLNFILEIKLKIEYLNMFKLKEFNSILIVLWFFEFNEKKINFAESFSLLGIKKLNYKVIL